MLQDLYAELETLTPGSVVSRGLRDEAVQAQKRAAAESKKLA